MPLHCIGSRLGLRSLGVAEPPDRRRPGPPARLPLPAPEREPGDETARVRLSEYVPDTTARDLPRLPRPPIDLDPDESAEWDADDNEATATIRNDIVDAVRAMGGDRTNVDPT